MSRKIAQRGSHWAATSFDDVVGIKTSPVAMVPRGSAISMSIREQAATRSPEIDALRGLALLGVVVVNYTTMFRTPILKYIKVFHTDTAPVHRVLDVVVGVAIESKAFAVFAMLFGAGMMSWAERGRPLTRRLLTLACFGIVHMLLWNGDILLFYALLGLAIMRFTAATPRSLLLMSALFFCIAAMPNSLPDLVPTGDARDEWIRRAEQAYTSRDLRTLFVFRLTEAHHVILPLLGGVSARTLACMFFGMAAWKSRVLPTPSRSRELLVRVAVACVLIGAVATGLELASIYGLIELTRVERTLHEVSVVALACGYSAGALRLFSGTPGRATSWLARLGRVSLTSYVTQSIIGGAIFYGYGLSLFGRLGSATVVGIAVAVYVLQGFIAPLLLRGGQGPLEKLWRYASVPHSR